jgi:hypothetical protein
LQGASTTRAANLAPNACIIGPVGLTLGSPENSGEIAALTSTVITSGGNPAPLTVTLGQVITVTVTLSFS